MKVKKKATGLPFLKGVPKSSTRKHKQEVRHIGRPRKEINWEYVYRCAKVHCTAEEISIILGVNLATLTQAPEFQELYQKAWMLGKKSLRRKQFEVALKDGNPTMLIWLGKQILGQRDKYYQEVTGPDGNAIPIMVEQRREPLRKLSIEDLKTLEAIMAKAEGNVIDVTPVETTKIKNVKVNGKAQETKTTGH